MCAEPQSPAQDFPPRLSWTWPLRLGYACYQCAFHLALPVLLVVLALRTRHEPLYGADLAQRFGAAPEVAPGGVWVFAASLGETRAVTPLLRVLLARGQTILLTHTTPAGLTEGRRQFAADIVGGRVVQSYAPVDLFWAQRRLLGRARPALALVVELETWPAQIVACLRAGVPIAKVNANLTERALSRDLGRVFGQLRLFFLTGFARVLTKTEPHAARYARAGVDPARIRVVGELKFDLAVRSDLVKRAAALRPALAGGRRVWMIASSIEAEEDQLHRVLHHLHHTLDSPPLVVWAPRSPQRFDAVADRLAADGYRTGRRSRIWDAGFVGTAPGDLDVLIADSLGEMDFSYALADVVFVGATLADMGGHNANEPLALERPVVCGPSTFAMPAPVDEAIDCGALRVFADAAGLAQGLADLLSDDDALTRFAAQARGLTAHHQGASLRSADALVAIGGPNG